MDTGISEQNDALINLIQNKHHRWQIDSRQIKQYSIGSSLDPSKLWWEHICLERRTLNFTSFRHGSCFTSLICEDLARLEPCHDVVRAIGPNIVFALLMDGPQIKGRWPERYAMGLSDDPGCSVLTLSSLGLIKRSNYLYGNDNFNIALWRDPINGKA